MALNLSDFLHHRPNIVPTIYGYSLPEVPDHDGYIKIGYTDREDVNQRIREQLHTAGLTGKLIFTESAVRSDGSCFTDHDVHRLLIRKGVQQLHSGKDKNEWYQCTKEEAVGIIKQIRTGLNFHENRTEDFQMRKEQQQAVNDTAFYFQKEKKDNPDSKPKYLWNAKMRFGKTFATYQLAKKMKMKRILVLTFKPAVESSWQDDLSRHIDFENWQFVSDKEAKYDNRSLDKMYADCDKSKPIVVFGSFQNLLGTNTSGGIKAKNEFIHTDNWDMIVFDEYHFGAWRDNAKKLFTDEDEDNIDFDIETYQKEESGNAINESWLPITTDYYLYLSGTPFRALNSGEFLEDQIFNWTYSDEQAAKEQWVSKENNPYRALPKMVMMTYKIPDSITQNAIEEGFDEFDINEFFRATHDTGSVEQAKFVYENDVQKWLKLIQGEYFIVDGLKLGNDKPPMPFSDTTLLNVLSHTLWFLPNVASCYAMKNLLHQRQNKFFDDYKIIVCAGTKAGIGIDAVKPVKEAMGNPLKTKTITLSCGKLTTGVTIRPWSGIFMLRNLKSPETYFQAAFRVQSPWEIVDKDGKKQVMKEECYIFDFALERSLRQISDYSCRLTVDDNMNTERKVNDFIHFLPVLAFDGAGMNMISAQDILDITYAGTSATLLAKRWQTALLVHVDNDTLKKLQSVPETLEALMNIEGFRALNQDINTIINRSEKVKKIKNEKGDELTAKEKKELTEDEKKAKSLRKQVQENLLKLASRIPAFMYLTDYREECIKDVITHTEPDLFKKVTGLHVKDFDGLCSIGLFDPEKMNQGIFGFRKYENSSLSYTGIDMHNGESVGGWDTVLRREEYESLYMKQQATITDFDFTMSIPKKILSYPKTKDFDTTTTSQHIKIKFSPSNTNISKEEITKKESMEKLKKTFVGTIVKHKKFGNGTISQLDKNKKYVKVQFKDGIKQFVFPSAFIDGFLTLE